MTNEQVLSEISKFSSAAAPLFAKNGWEWFVTSNGMKMVPEAPDIELTCATLLGVCQESLANNPNKYFTYASTGRITCVLCRGDIPKFSLTIT